MNEVRAEQAKIAQEVSTLQQQQGNLNRQEQVVGNGYIPPNAGVAGYGVGTGSHVAGTTYTGYNYASVGHGKAGYTAHGYNPNNQFYDRLRAAVNVQPSYTYLNTDDAKDADEIAGIPVGGFIGIIVGVVCLCVIACCLLRYIFFPRKFQTPDDMEMDQYGNDGMGMSSAGRSGMSAGNMSPRIDHMKGANNDIYASNTSLDPNIPGKQYD